MQCLGVMLDSLGAGGPYNLLSKLGHFESERAMLMSVLGQEGKMEFPGTVHRVTILVRITWSIKQDN
jgi:hypothetical protein